jgi:hypothetical protein
MGREVGQAVEPWGDIVGLETKGSGYMTYEKLVCADSDYIATFDPPTVLALLDEVERLRLEVCDRWVETRLRADLLDYGNHRKGCDPSACTCGWQEIQKALEADRD